MALIGLRAVAPASDGPPAVFLDKDGTLVEDIPYNVNPRLMRLTPGAVRGLCALSQAGFALVVVSNQPGVALGLHTEHDLDGVRRWLADRFAPLGVRFAGFYWCPHHPQGLVAPFARACACRKPRPGMIVRAAREHGLSLRGSWFVGDILDDVEAGRRAGCRTVMLDNGHETIWRRSPLRTPDLKARDLGEAAERILALHVAAPLRQAAT